MKSRFLSFVALAGMLVAAGCSGGGSAGSTSSLTPGVTPGAGGTSTGSSSAANGGIALSFQIPIPSENLGTTSTGRHQLYISPASTGLQILTSLAGAGTFAVGTQGTPLQLQASGQTGTVNAGAYGASGAAGCVAGTALTAQLSNGFVDNTASPTTYPVNTIPGSASGTPVVGQCFTVTNSTNQLSAILKIQSFTGTAASGLFMTVVDVSPVAGSGNTFATGNQINILANATSGSTYSYTFTPQTAATGTLGYYNATVTLSGMNTGVNYVVGVVLTDTANSNYVLSEGQSAATLVTAGGPTNIPITLRAVVAGAYLPAGTLMTTAGTATGAPASSYSTTLFATDERGYVIPTTTGTAPVTPDDAPAYVITPNTAGQLTFGIYDLGGGYTQLANTTTSLTSPPILPAASYNNGGTPDGSINAAGTQVTISAAAGVAPYNNPLGKLFVNYNVPTAPFTLPLVSGTTTNANGAGSPLNIVCAAAGSANVVKITLGTTGTGTIGGYTYSAANYPAAGPTTLATGTSSNIATVNCTPSIVLPIN